MTTILKLNNPHLPDLPVADFLAALPEVDEVRETLPMIQASPQLGALYAAIMAVDWAVHGLTQATTIPTDDMRAAAAGLRDSLSGTILAMPEARARIRWSLADAAEDLWQDFAAYDPTCEDPG